MTYHISSYNEPDDLVGIFETELEAEAFLLGVFAGADSPELAGTLTYHSVDIDAVDELVLAVKRDLPDEVIERLKRRLRDDDAPTSAPEPATAWIVELHHGDGSWGRSGNCSGTYDTAGEAFSAIQQFGNPFDVAYRVRNTVTNETAEVDE